MLAEHVQAAQLLFPHLRSHWNPGEKLPRELPVRWESASSSHPVLNVPPLSNPCISFLLSFPFLCLLFDQFLRYCCFLFPFFPFLFSTCALCSALQALTRHLLPFFPPDLTYRSWTILFIRLSNDLIIQALSFCVFSVFFVYIIHFPIQKSMLSCCYFACN